MEQIRRSILDNVCRRMAQEFGILMRPQGDTERFDRVLALWIDVQRAIHLRKSHNPKLEGCTPWNCLDARVRTAWDALTHPRNLVALESLYYQSPDGPQLEMARQALQTCRERSKGK